MNLNLYKFTFILVLLPLFSQGQQEASVWFVGSNRQISFGSGSFEVNDFGLNGTFNASICDKNGNLLLYSNGYAVWNAKNEVLTNGEDLTEGAFRIIGQPIFVPYPGKEGHYLLFYTKVPESGYDLRSKKLVFAEIDCLAGNGKGEVLVKNEFLHDDFHDYPTIAGYCKNSYYWLAVDRNDNVHEPSRDQIYFYKIDEKGVHKTPKTNGYLDMGHSLSYKFSPNGDKLAFYYGYNQPSGWDNIVADFDFLNGELYNFRALIGEDFFSREFSGNSQYLYYFMDEKLIQTDVRYSSWTKIRNSKTVVMELPYYGEEYSADGAPLQLASDGRIYFCYFDPQQNKSKVGRINYPNRKGKDCGVELNVYTFDESILEFPRFATSFFRSKEPEYIDEVFPDAGPPIEICSRTSAPIGKSEQSPNAYYQWFPMDYISDPFQSNTIITAPKIRGGIEEKDYTLRATDGNCWLKFNTTGVTFLPEPEIMQLDGSWSVCPYVENVEYWTDNTYKDVKWLIDGGEIAEVPSKDTVTVNWWNTNANASVNAYYSNNYGCLSDTAKFPVRINVVLITETPKGEQSLCLSQANNISYEIRKTNGSEYFWKAEDGEIISGQGTNKIRVNWEIEGTHHLTVDETSKTIDTICFGESEPLMVEVINDSLQIELSSVSFNAYENIDLNYYSAKFDRSRHKMSIIVADEFDNFIKEVSIADSYIRADDVLNSEILQLKLTNICDEHFYSNKQQSIVLKNVGYDDNSVELEWNQNKFWEHNHLEDELWHSVSPNEGWELLGVLQQTTNFSYDNESLHLDHYFKVREKNSDTGFESWSNILNVKFDDKIFIPDVFTPNGDGYNDVWVINNIEYHEFKELDIFNRYGQKVFSCKNEFVPWDGETSDGVKQGTYFYQLTFGTGEIRYGQITVLQ